MQKQECVELIKSFIVEKLDGDIRKFHDYDLDQLENDKMYGAYDPDNSKIANAIYVVLWGDTVPSLTFNNLGGEIYRGDTMNSFNTLMGRLNEDGTSFLGIQKYTHDSNTIDLAKMYHQKYHTLGNLIILPNKRLESENKTLNTLRGGGYWFDYFDLFLSDIKDLITDTSTNNIDDRLKELVKINSNFFDCFRGTEGFKDFCKTFYLDKYIDYESLNVREVFSPHARHWGTKFSEKEYKQNVASYITKATEIIDYRCGRMIEDIEKEIIKYDPTYIASSTFMVSPKAEKQQSQTNEKKTNPAHNKMQLFILDKTESFISWLKESPLKSISLILVVFTIAFCGGGTIYSFIQYIKLGGYNSSLSPFDKPQTPFDFYANHLIPIILLLLACSILTLFASYIKKNKGIRKILMLLTNIITIILVMTPMLIVLFTYDVWLKNTDDFYSLYKYLTSGGTINFGTGILIYIIAFFVCFILPYILVIFNKELRTYLKYWFLTFLITLLGMPLAISLIFGLTESTLGFIILCVIAGTIILRFMWFGVSKVLQGYRSRCPSCKKWYAMVTDQKEFLGQERISIHVSNKSETVDRDGNVSTTYSKQYIPGIRETYRVTCVCKHCGNKEIFIETNDKKSV